MITRPLFFEHIRQHLFASKIFQAQVDGLTAILDEWEHRGLTDPRWLAYIMATVYHETGRRMQPVEEYGKGKGRWYGTKTKQSGKPYKYPNKIYYGRGIVQITWYENYDRIGGLTGVDLLTRPELALQMDVSLKITFGGMLNGWFTGRKLSDYLNGEQADFMNARRIINGIDCAEKIAGYAKEFYTAVKL